MLDRVLVDLASMGTLLPHPKEGSPMDEAVGNTSGSGPFKHSKIDRPIFIATVSRCLTEKHQDCTGLYANALLGLKVKCTCSCHRETVDDARLQQVNKDSASA